MSAATVADTRGTIHLEDAPILAHDAYQGGQQILRLHAPGIAAAATPGSFAHLRCDERLAMRRPMSIMRVDREQGWIEFLYKTVGTGTGLLARRAVGQKVSVLGPIGQGFSLLPDRPKVLLVGGGVGIPPMLFLAERMVEQRLPSPLVLMGSEVPFPFATRPSTILVDGIPAGVIAAITLLDDWGVASRLASTRGYPGCHEGYVTELAREWLLGLAPEVRSREVAIYSCGPTPMLRAVAALAAEFELPAQVCLEEFMACAVGGCAGCTVRLRLPDGDAMKRVCVDGPVFDASVVAWDGMSH